MARHTAADRRPRTILLITTAISRSTATAASPIHNGSNPAPNGTNTSQKPRSTYPSAIAVTTCTTRNATATRDTVRCRRSTAARGNPANPTLPAVAIPSTITAVNNTNDTAPVARLVNHRTWMFIRPAPPFPAAGPPRWPCRTADQRRRLRRRSDPAQVRAAPRREYTDRPGSSARPPFQGRGTAHCPPAGCAHAVVDPGLGDDSGPGHVDVLPGQVTRGHPAAHQFAASHQPPVSAAQPRTRWNTHRLEDTGECFPPTCARWPWRSRGSNR